MKDSAMAWRLQRGLTGIPLPIRAEGEHYQKLDLLCTFFTSLHTSIAE
jgi:hypothetical protein